MDFRPEATPSKAAFRPPATPAATPRGSQASSYNRTPPNASGIFPSPSPVHHTHWHAYPQLAGHGTVPQGLLPKQDDADEHDELDEDELSDDDSPNGFKIRDRLNLPTRSEYTTKELHFLIHQGELDLSPPYQRDVVWPKAKQMQLIDSLFRNFYIPPIVLAQVTDEDSDTTKRCVDGKQRLTSMQNFIDGLIPYRDSRTKKEYYYTNIADKTHKQPRLEIPADCRQWFDAVKIQCVEYTALSQIVERDIFQRVQLGVSLTAAEKLQAIASPWAEWISQLEYKHVFIDNGLGVVLQIDTNRARGFQDIANFVFCCEKLSKQPTPTAKALETWITRLDPPPPHFTKRIDTVLDDMTNLSGTDGFTKIGKRVAPVEFVFIGVLLYVMNDHSDQERARAIFDLRKTVRASHADIRTNTACCRTLWKFINQKDAPGAPSKRKRRPSDPNSDPEYDPEPTFTTSKGRRVTRPRMR